MKIFNVFERVFLNGFEYQLNRDKLLLRDKNSNNDADNISIYSNRLTKNEKQQLQDYIKYGKKK